MVSQSLQLRCTWPNITCQSQMDQVYTNSPSSQITHGPNQFGLFDGSMFLTQSQAFSFLKAIPTYFMYVSKFLTQDVSKKLIICIQHISSWIDTCMPLLNPCQCTVPHGGMLSSQVSREYLPNRAWVRIWPFMQDTLITCSTKQEVHWLLVFLPDLQKVPKECCKTTQSLSLYLYVRTWGRDAIC